MLQKTLLYNRRNFVLALSALPAVAAGCANPNGGGVQDFGTIVGRVVDSKTQQPVPNGLLNVGLITSHLDNQGGFVLTNVPVGQQTVNINVTGYPPWNQTVSVQKDQTTDLGVIQLASIS